jgi:hypothetical protein
MQKQIKMWQDKGIVDRIPKDLYKAYVVLAGNLNDAILRNDGMTWFQDFAMRLCYNGIQDIDDSGNTEGSMDSCTTSDTVAKGLLSYRKAFSMVSISKRKRANAIAYMEKHCS